MQVPKIFRSGLALAVLGMFLLAGVAAAQSDRLQSSDLLKLRTVGDVQLSPDGSRAVYTVVSYDGPGRPYAQLWLMNLENGKSARLGSERDTSSSAEWSPDGQWLAYLGTLGDKFGLLVARADGSGAKFLAPFEGTNSPINFQGRSIAWSPDNKRIAFVHALPGPETAEATGDPVVITRYLYKPDYGEGLTRFNDNRRLHIFIADVASGQVRQLTSGNHYEHSIDWSPSGEEILFVSNRESNEDQFFNHDLFTVKVADGSIRRLTATESAEYQPRWSPDGKTILYLGTRRGLTDLETTMEDTHVWLINADGSNRRELGAKVDNRQQEAGWAPDGSAVYFTLQERGNVKLMRLPISGGPPRSCHQ
jgi:Tol biopolymer transport system component